MKRYYLLVGCILIVAIFYFFDVGRFFSLGTIKARQADLLAFRDSHPLLLSISYFIIYVVVAALSLPGATVLTLAGGGIFGLVWGFAIISFASSIGATLAFLAARYLFRDFIQSRFGTRLTPINQGMEENGAYYLFSLRLVPIFPFFLINILMGLTPIPTFTYYWVSQLGMIAGTLVYVNAGTQLAQINSLKGIVAPELLLSFVLIGLFPLVAKKANSWISKKRIYKKWRKPERFDRNLVVIGAGAAGLVSAYIAAATKAKVTLIEAHKMGGDCLNYGCVPSKALIKTAHLVHQIRNGAALGLNDGMPVLNFHKVMERVHNIIATVEPHDSKERYEKLGVEVLSGKAKFIDPWTIEVAETKGAVRRITTRATIIAAGAEPYIPSIPGIEGSGYLTSYTLWDALLQYRELPKRIIVLGGGPIGCELSQCLARLGAEVTQVVRGKQLLAREDEDVAELVKAVLENDGVTVLTEHTPLCFSREGEEKIFSVSLNGLEKHIVYDLLICAVGRTARLRGYGLEELGITTSRTIPVNECLETLYPNIFAAGDVAGPFQFTHTAAHQAWYATVNALFGEWKKFKADYTVIPWTTFIDPEIARVGINEKEAKAQNIAYELTKFSIKDLDRAITDSNTLGFIKVLTAPGKDRILGVTIASSHGGDLLPEFVLAMKNRLGLRKILSTIHTYPTMAEANKFVAGEWQKSHAPRKLLNLAEKYHAWKRREHA